MPLVNYDSDPDDEVVVVQTDTKSKQASGLLQSLNIKKNKVGPKKLMLEKETVVESVSTETLGPKDNNKKRTCTSIASLLPPPKNRKVKKSEDVSQSSGLMDTSGNHEEPPQTTSATTAKLIPAAVAAKMLKKGKSVRPNSVAVAKESRKIDDAKPTKALPNLFSFQEQSLQKPRPATSQDYVPVMLEKKDEEEEAKEGNVEPSTLSERIDNSSLYNLASQSGLNYDEISKYESRRNQSSNEKIKVLDFNVDDFYQQNDELREKGLLDANKRPVQGLGGGKHQITTLLRSAMQNKDELEEMFAQGRRNKAAAGSKYGF